MPQDPLDYRSPSARDPSVRPGRPAALAAAAMVAANAALLGSAIVAWSPRWAFLALIASPAVNLTLMLVALGCTPLARAYLGDGGSLRPYLLVSFAMPVLLWF